MLWKTDLHAKYFCCIYVRDKLKTNEQSEELKKMKWKQIPLGALQTNCYLLYNDEKQCIIIDPGAQGEELNGYLAREGFKPLAVLLTHAHFDHIGAVDAVRDYWNIPVYIHQLEAEWLTDPALNGSIRFADMEHIAGKPADVIISGEKILEIGPFTLSLFETPGHSPGSLSYYVEDANLVFSGDALFQRGIGRTDLRDGDHQQLIQSIQNKLFVLPRKTTVLSGHGGATTIGNEQDHNPYLQ